MGKIVITAQELLPPRTVLDVPPALASAALGVVIIVDPSAVPGLTPPI